jgi:hypothetical protein
VPRTTAAANVGESPPHVDPAAAQVNIADSQGGGLTPAQPGVAKQEDEHAPGSGLVGQAAELAVVQEYVVTPTQPGRTQPMSRVRPNPATSRRVIERGRHDEYGLPDTGRPEVTVG